MHADPDGTAANLDEAASIFAGVRRRLFGLAYRMLGSKAEAEDVVQEVWLRWQTYDDRGSVLDPAAFLVTTAVRLAINAVQSARARRETYIGPWLPEPVDTRADPELGAVRGEALELAVLFLLEKLSATERAAYVLREAFDYAYAQIADILEINEANARQLVTRARTHLASERRTPASPSEQRRFLDAFIRAAQAGDRSALEALFVADVANYSDGGGVLGVARVPVVGRARVAKFIASFAHKFWIGVSFTWTEANGRPSILLSRDGLVFGLVTVEASEQGIEQLMWVMNPVKLEDVGSALVSPNADPA
ncbi:sigma-70 family RNA polymerase sigma factor [Pendulispora rubella]|uniref:Sigma-70 family RNA polymerase sigma factor n=1 Tax=Pendulispora rubella TaxID=2741070 RepID=A0ABZ2KPL4_9BACT